jgi:hypothetical protein
MAELASQSLRTDGDRSRSAGYIFWWVWEGSNLLHHLVLAVESPRRGRSTACGPHRERRHPCSTPRRISAAQSGRAGVSLRSASLIVRIFERKSWAGGPKSRPAFLRKFQPSTLVQEESNHLHRCVGTVDIRIGSAGMSTGPRVPSPLNQPILHDRATIRARNFSSSAGAAIYLHPVRR